ncbi:putative ORFan [Tupanvirus deep ocean]|uniref:ORFan n=2 Tax=Tupanvirus TaxID=2094720 RepID=A0AC62A9H5_9VIRU|nr:putative ORFan [Tupanvirus deep ocean]QKU34427.1 putative ORFan [Tupanvirus deep ocean]
MYIQPKMSNSLSHRRLLYSLIHDEMKKNHLDNAEMLDDILKKSKITIGHINLVQNIMYNATDNLENLKDLLSMMTIQYHSQSLSDNEKSNNNKKSDNKKSENDILSDDEILSDNEIKLNDEFMTVFKKMM